MRVLQIAPETPGKYSGGKLGIRQTLLSLADNGYEIDYVGPAIEDQEICMLYTNTYFLEPSNDILLRIFDTLHRNTNKRYRAWLKLQLDFTVYDAIILEFTKLDYVLKRIPTDRLVVRVHNVEADYSEKNYQYHKSIINYIDKSFSKGRERAIVNAAQKLLVLTEKDKRRIQELYQVPDEKIRIVPVCVEEPVKTDVSLSEDKTVHMVITGSLWFGPNYEGIKWFLENVYTKLKVPTKLVIAGSRPNNELIERAKNLSNVVLVASPDSMAPFFKEADLAIATVFDGAGMKVKVAEALSYGLPVVGTKHAFEGYKVQHGVNSYCADTADEFMASITDFYQREAAQRQQMKKESHELYLKFYSQKRSSQLFREVLNTL